MEGQEEIQNLIKEYFEEIYKPPDPGINRDCIRVIPNLVSQEMNDVLMKEVTDKEIKEAAFDLGALKAPRPDGLSGIFYQTHWEAIKSDICGAIRSFFEDRTLPPKINETVVALVPKIPLPENITQLRPISCCNFIYKIISKVIASRLKVFLGDLVSQQQSAFVGGRLIQDNLIIAQEVFHSLKRRDKGGEEKCGSKIGHE